LSLISFCVSTIPFILLFPFCCGTSSISTIPRWLEGGWCSRLALPS